MPECLELRFRTDPVMTPSRHIARRSAHLYQSRREYLIAVRRFAQSSKACFGSAGIPASGGEVTCRSQWHDAEDRAALRGKWRIKPSTSSFTVPSPPPATTRSNGSRTDEALSIPCSHVTRTSTTRPDSRSAPARPGYSPTQKSILRSASLPALR